MRAYLRRKLLVDCKRADSLAASERALLEETALFMGLPLHAVDVDPDSLRRSSKTIESAARDPRPVRRKFRALWERTLRDHREGKDEQP